MIKKTIELFVLSVGLCCLVPNAAQASPWTLPQGDVVVSGGIDYQLATSEFVIEGGGEQNFPLNGRYLGGSFRVSARAGFTDRLELEISIPFRTVTYQSDPVILLPRADGSMESELDYYQRNVLDFTTNRVGVGDLTLAGRYGLVRDPFPLAVELRLKAPTGYDGPEGTFGENPASAEVFLADAGTFVAPENIRDDVTLGDGQLDLAASILFGYSFPTRTFVRLDVGYNLRTAGAADEFNAAFKAGQLFGGSLLVYGEARFSYAIEEGRSIGISVGAENPNLAAQEYGGLTNLVLREVRLERDALDVGAGILLKVSDDVEVFAGYNRTVWGRNTAAINNFYSGIAVHASFLEQAVPEAADETEVFEEEYEYEYVEEPIEEPTSPPVDEHPVEPETAPGGTDLVSDPQAEQADPGGAM